MNLSPIMIRLASTHEPAPRRRRIRVRDGNDGVFYVSRERRLARTGVAAACVLVRTRVYWSGIHCVLGVCAG